MMSDTLWIILAAAFVTYLTRIGGYLVLSRFETIHPRVQAGLDAVPAAVLTTIVAPAVVSGGINEWIAFGVAVLVGLRMSLLPVVTIGTVLLIVLRHFNG